MEKVFIKNNNNIYYLLLKNINNLKKIEEILEGKLIKNVKGLRLLGPKLHIDTPLCSNILDIFNSINITNVEKIELFKIVKKNIKYDDTILKLYKNKIESNDEELHIKNNVVRSSELSKYFDEMESEYYKKYYEHLGRYPTYLEIFDLIQSNSEHCRHWFFRGNFFFRNKKLKSPMKLIKDTIKYGNHNSIIAFSDNSSVIKGFKCFNTYVNHTLCKYEVEEIFTHPVLTAETHNFPTGISPFHGAATGVGGRMRDNMATGRGSIPIASLAGYSVGNLKNKYNSYFSDPLEILIEASNGASDYGNKVGEPIIGGYTSSYYDNEYEYVKPIMFSAGLSKIFNKHVYKGKPSEGDNIIVFGGPAYKIGFGGGSASSKSQNKKDLHAVQRGDPYVQNKMKQVVIKCTELLEENPIKSIHDQGAGGIANVTKELCEPYGGSIELNKMKQAQKNMSSIEIYCSEFQESNAILCTDEDLDLFKNICDEENVGYNILGKVNNSDYFSVYHDDNLEGEFDMKYLEENKLKKDYKLKKCNMDMVIRNLDTSTFNLNEEIEKIFTNINCCSKRFLTSKVDRSVSGLVARQQCIGPYHLPISDFSVVAFSSYTNRGFASSIGEGYIHSILNPVELPKYVVGEMLTNLIGSNFTEVSDIKFSANWMWPKGLDSENEKLYAAIYELHNTCKGLGISIDGGKDSLSMYTKKDNKIIKSPGTLVCTSYVPVENVFNNIPQYFQKKGNSIFLISPAYLINKRFRLGGSLFHQNHNIKSSDVPTIDNYEVFKFYCEQLNSLCKMDIIKSIHDIGKGGLFLHLVEMSLGSGLGLKCSFNNNINLYEFMFNEELGWIIEIDNLDYDLIKSLNPINLGYVLPDNKISINNNKFNIKELRILYEKTSLDMQLKQTNKECVEQERQMINSNLHLFNNVLFSINNNNNYNGKKVAIIRELGSNGDREMCNAFSHAGFKVYNFSINKLLKNPSLITSMNGLAFSGGFSFGDSIKSAKGWALRIKNNKKLYDMFKKFFDSDYKFTLGVCNGCQLLLELGLFGNTKLVKNDSNRFESRYSYLKITKENTYLHEMKDSILGCWVAHGEGKFINVDKNQICIVYSDYSEIETQYYPENPNGSEYGCAALFRKKGNILAMMPHPERTFLYYQIPNKNDTINNFDSTYGPWFKLFTNLRN